MRILPLLPSPEKIYGVKHTKSLGVTRARRVNMDMRKDLEDVIRSTRGGEIPIHI